MGDLESVDVHIAFGAGELVINSLAEGSPQLIDSKVSRAGGHYDS